METYITDTAHAKHLPHRVSVYPTVSQLEERWTPVVPSRGVMPSDMCDPGQGRPGVGDDGRGWSGVGDDGSSQLRTVGGASYPRLYEDANLGF